MNTRTRLPDLIHHLKLSMVREGDRLRPVNPERVKELAASWRMNGQLTPIEVGPADAEGIHTLIAGGHRLAAAREAGEATIAAVIVDVSDTDRLRLREIDENLYRAELSPLDEAVFLAARKEIYERIHPETAHGKAPARKDANLASLPKARAFAADVAEKIGLSERTVGRALTRWKRLSEESRRRLRGTPIGENGVELDALCKRTPEQQSVILDMVLAATPRAASVREAWRMLSVADADEEPDPEAIARKLERLFWQLPKGKPRRDFVTWAKANIERDRDDAA